MTLLGALLIVGWTVAARERTPLPHRDRQETRRMVTLLTVDLDGDGREDAVLGEATAVPAAYRRIMVRGATGVPLLDVADESLFYAVLVAMPDSPHPILIAGVPSGNWLQVEAYMYRPEAGRLEGITWDGQGHVRGRAVQVDAATRAIVM